MFREAWWSDSARRRVVGRRLIASLSSFWHSETAELFLHEFPAEKCVVLPSDTALQWNMTLSKSSSLALLRWRWALTTKCVVKLPISPPPTNGLLTAPSGGDLYRGEISRWHIAQATPERANVYLAFRSTDFLREPPRKIVNVFVCKCVLNFR